MGARLPIALALSLAGACALSGRAEHDADGGSAPAPDEPRGSATCQRWQKGFCDFASDRCALIERARCDAQNEGVICASDDEAARCADAFPGSTCSVPPLGCEVVDIADVQAAAELCEGYFEAQCESNTRCGIFDSVEQCLASPAFTFDCTRAVSIGLGYERCLEELATRRCDRDVPICDEVIRAR